MAEGTYEYECNRAELLGIAPPNHVQWQETEKVRREKEHAEELAVRTIFSIFFSLFYCLILLLLFNLICLKELDIQDEEITQNTGKMDEINNILSMTQMRLNKFKVRLNGSELNEFPSFLHVRNLCQLKEIK